MAKHSETERRVQRKVPAVSGTGRTHTDQPNSYRNTLGLIGFRGQFDYAACLSVNILSNSAGLTIPMAE